MKINSKCASAGRALKIKTNKTIGAAWHSPRDFNMKINSKCASARRALKNKTILFKDTILFNKRFCKSDYYLGDCNHLSAI